MRNVFIIHMHASNISNLDGVLRGTLHERERPESRKPSAYVKQSQQ